MIEIRSKQLVPIHIYYNNAYYDVKMLTEGYINQRKHKYMGTSTCHNQYADKLFMNAPPQIYVTRRNIILLSYVWGLNEGIDYLGARVREIWTGNCGKVEVV